jgi:uncharacterized glyoxalase superfamily protein PhnB
MAVKPIPDGYHTVTPYLIVPDVPKLIDFLVRALGAREIHRMTRPDGTVNHAEVRLGNSMVMMGHASDQYPPMPAMFYLYVEDVDALYRQAVAAGGVSLREPTDQDYGDRSGGVSDPFGNQWWIGTHIRDVPAP